MRDQPFHTIEAYNLVESDNGAAKEHPGSSLEYFDLNAETGGIENPKKATDIRALRYGRLFDRKSMGFVQLYFEFWAISNNTSVQESKYDPNFENESWPALSD